MEKKAAIVIFGFSMVTATLWFGISVVLRDPSLWAIPLVAALCAALVAMPIWRLFEKKYPNSWRGPAYAGGTIAILTHVLFYPVGYCVVSDQLDSVSQFLKYSVSLAIMSLVVFGWLTLPLSAYFGLLLQRWVLRPENRDAYSLPRRSAVRRTRLGG